MKRIAIIFGLLLMAFLTNAQEFTIGEVFQIDMLVFNTESQAEKIADKLFQVGVEVETQEGTEEDQTRYFIELQDVSILDIEIKNSKGEWKRWFPKNIKDKLITISLIE
jgi:hypothetical protein